MLDRKKNASWHIACKAFNMASDAIRIIRSHNGHAIEYDDVILEVWRDGLQWWGRVAWKRDSRHAERFTAPDEYSAKERCLKIAGKADGYWQAGSFSRR